jgi:hypothetical protein
MKHISREDLEQLDKESLITIILELQEMGAYYGWGGKREKAGELK